MRRAAALFAAALLAGAAAPVVAEPPPAPDRPLADPAQEARARALFRQIRCLVCQNESIDDSDADLAEDLRKLVRGQVAEGKTDAEVRSYLTDRYGDFVLLKPRFSAGNAILWLAPFAVVLVGGVAFVMLRRRETTPAPLSEEEEARLQALTGDRDGV